MTARSGIKSLTIALLVLLTVAWSGLAGAADVKVGKISLQTIYTKSKRIQAEVQKMQRIQSEGQAKLVALTSDVQSLKSKLGAAKTKEDKDKLEAELKVKKEALESERQSIGVQLSFAQQSLQNQFKTELKSIIDKTAKAKGLSLVVEDGTVLYSSGITDLTGEVLNALDKAGTPPAGKKPAPKPAPAKPAGPAKGGTK